MADPEQALRGDGIFFQAGKSVVFAETRFKLQSKNGIRIGENEVFIVLAKDRPIGIILDSGEIELDFIAIFVIQDIAGVLIEPGDGTISIDIPNLSFEGIRRGLELAAIEGIVFWHEGAPLCKIKRSDFGFKWPVTQDELNAEFGANNPDPCKLVRRTAAMYSRHEFPADMTKMFDAEHEATKEEEE